MPIIGVDTILGGSEAMLRRTPRDEPFVPRIVKPFWLVRSSTGDLAVELKAHFVRLIDDVVGSGPVDVREPLERRGG